MSKEAKIDVDRLRAAYGSAYSEAQAIMRGGK